MKKRLGLLIATLFMIAGCAGGEAGGDDEEGGSGSGTVTVKVRFHVDLKSAEGIAYQKLITDFNNKYLNEGIKATAVYKARKGSDAAYEQELAKDLMDGTLPDIFTFDAPNCAAYAKEGLLWDFTSELSSTEKAQYMTLNTYNGKVYGLPIQESSAGFYYNKTLFRNAGIDVSGITVDNPWTFNEFKSVCAKLASSGVTPVDMRMDATNETGTYLLYPFIYAAGGSFVDETGSIATGYFNSAASKRGFQFLKDLVDAKYTNYGIGSTDFFDGKVGMYLSSGWTIPQLDHDYPKVFPNRDAWGLLPYPQDATRASANGSWSFAIGNNSRKDKTPVVKLLKFLTNKDSSKTITDATGMIPANREVETNYPVNSPEALLYQQLVETSKARPTTVCYPQFSNVFTQVISEMRDGNVSSIVDNKATVLQGYLDRNK